MAHHHLGASGAERWMKCSGSVGLIKSLSLPESDEEEWRLEGQVAHALAAEVLSKNIEPWEMAGTVIDGVTVTPEMVDAIYVYSRECHKFMDSNRYEVRIECPLDLPRKSFGTADFIYYDWQEHVVGVIDFKYGKGIYVAVVGNPQVRDYAWGALQEFPDARRVRMAICQPRILWADDPVRWDEMSTEDLCTWVDTELVPAMKRTETDRTLVPGEHCRFCPAKLYCPALNTIFSAALAADPKQVLSMDDQHLAENYKIREVARMYLKTLEDEMFRRMKHGKEMPGFKLVAKKANRVWRSTAIPVLQARLGSAIYWEPELKTPPQIELISDEAKGLVKEWAYTPQSGVTIAPANDPRPAMKPDNPVETFADAIDKELHGSQV